MSVINKVLKDLDKRQQQHSDESPQGAEANGFQRPEVQFTSQVNMSKGTTTDSASSSNKSLLMSVLMLVAVALLGIMLYRQGMQLQKLQPLTPERVNNNASVVVNPNENLGDDQPMVTAVKSSDESISLSQSMIADASFSSNEPTDAMKQDDDKIAEEESVVDRDVKPKNTDIAAVEIARNESKQDIDRAVKVNKVEQTQTNDSGSVQVRFSQNTRSSAIVADNQKETANNVVTINESKPTSTTARNSVSATANKGSMAVTEVVLSNAELAQKKFDIAEVAEQQQKVDRAIKYYYEALMLEPSMHQARKQLASLYYALNNLGRAEQILAQGVVQFPEEVELAILKAKVENASFSPDKALITLSGVSDSSDWARDKWILQSDIAQKNGQFELAESAYRSLVGLEPSQARWWMGLAYALDSQQAYKEAAETYRKALSYRGLSTGAMTYIEQRLIQLEGSQ